jgi:predicted Mrr-cat superfamily restriction endonuclease
MMFEGKEKESAMKEELMEYKHGKVNEVSDYMQKGDKINYFDEEFHECFS